MLTFSIPDIQRARRLEARGEGPDILAQAGSIEGCVLLMAARDPKNAQPRGKNTF